MGDVVLEPVDLSMAAIKHISAQLLVKMWEYIVGKPQLIVKGFVRSRICGALDDLTSDDELDELLEELDEVSDISSLSGEEPDSYEVDDESVICTSNSPSCYI